MRGRLGRLLGAAALAALAGCAYEVAGRVEVMAPGRLAGVRRVAVAPFRYPNDWTGHFQDVYRRADVPPPPGRRVDLVEATFLIEDALAARGYPTLPWPAGEEEAPPGPPPRALLERLRGRGIEAALLVHGESRCESLERCAARVAMALWETAGGALLWRAEATAATLLHQGDEMKAAAEEALAGLPAGPGKQAGRGLGGGRVSDPNRPHG